MKPFSKDPAFLRIWLAMLSSGQIVFWLFFLMENQIKFERGVLILAISFIGLIAAVCILAAVSVNRGLFVRTIPVQVLVLFICRWIVYQAEPYTSSPEVGPLNWVLLHLTVSLVYQRWIRDDFGTRWISRAVEWLRVEAIWWMLSLIYLVSAIGKLESPTWQDGTALSRILSGPFGSGLGVWVAEHFPQLILRTSTWAALGLEFLFLLTIVRSSLLRFTLTGMFLVMMVVIALVTDLGQVAYGMILVHLYSLLLQSQSRLESKRLAGSN